MEVEIISRIIKDKMGFSEVNVVKNNCSSVGNVYNVLISDINLRYIVKIYNDFKHVQSMIKISGILNNCKIRVPKIIDYFLVNGVYIVIYEFLDGRGIKYDDDLGCINRELISNIAKNVRRIHDCTTKNVFGVDLVDWDFNLDRKSLLHFDLTKDNIFYNGNIIEFIDFDDAKYGSSIIDISILIALLFFSKKRGVDSDGVKLFINEYYRDDIELKNYEVKFIKECSLKWIDMTVLNNNFTNSINESFEIKKKLIEKYM